MVSYRYLNKLLIGRLPARSGRFKLAPESPRPASNSGSGDNSNNNNNNNNSTSTTTTTSNNSSSLNPSERLGQSASEPELDSKENLAPSEESKSKRRREESSRKLQAKLIRTMTLRGNKRSSSTRKPGPVRGKKFAILESAELSLRLAFHAAPILLLLALAVCFGPASGTGTDAATATSRPLQPLGRQFTRAPALGLPANFLPPSSIDWRRISARLLRQLQRLPGRNPERLPARQPGRPLARILGRLRQRIGARNTIRVHNVFRDFAWRVLSSMSMPTPVIYELRRQNFYSPEEDAANDAFFNRNTTKSIRTRRLLHLLEPSEGAGSVLARRANRRASDDNDDDEPETFRERLRARLEDLLSLSRRSLFGRVVRVPSLFPFKRQEEENATDGRVRAPATGNEAKQGAASKQRPRFLAFASGFRDQNRESDRQIIEINGKRFFVDDDGELKELKGQS